MTNNPWEDIDLFDYEKHMNFDTVEQLQILNKIMKKQLETYSASSAIIFGVAGGNGLEYVDKKKYKKIYGIDINKKYLEVVKQRYKNLSDYLECIQLNLITEYKKLPEVELLIANLIIEYIGYEVFWKTILYVKPQYISCVIQDNIDKGQWVSQSPYISVFDKLEIIRHKIQETELSEGIKKLGYSKIKKMIYFLPDGKRFIQLDYKFRNNICRGN